MGLSCFSVFADSPITRDDFIKKLFPNPWDALTTFLSFIVLLIIVFYFAYKPVKKIINERRNYLEQKMSNAEKAEQDAILKSREAELKIEQSKLEAIEIVKKAKEDAIIAQEKVKESAKADIQREKELAKEEIEQEFKKSKEDVHDHIVDVALSATEKILNREVNSKDNQKLIDDFIEDVNK